MSENKKTGDPVMKKMLETVRRYYGIDPESVQETSPEVREERRKSLKILHERQQERLRKKREAEEKQEKQD